MAERLIDTSILTAEANALRRKGAVGGIEYKSNGFADAIDAISGGNPYLWDLLTVIKVTAPTGSAVTCVKGATTLTEEEESGTWMFIVPEAGAWTVNASKGAETASSTVTTAAGGVYEVALNYPHIYGAIWDGSSAAWVRTDEAADFAEPTPAVNNGTGSSPFDAILPWAGVVKEEIASCGTMVKIPKFWFRWTTSGGSLKLQIANGPVDGFMVSPAHQDRGDGHGERDYVYVGRYHCNGVNFKSQTGYLPAVNIPRSAARGVIHNLGSDVWQFDFATRMTIQMLYLVEFADWGSQEKVGYGCGSSSAVENVGATDAMQYHTGTSKSSRDDSGVGVQYRWIEGLWDNCYDWLDGCYHNASGMHLIKNPAAFSDTSGGTLIGVPTEGFPTEMSVADAEGFEWAIYPSAADDTEPVSVPDYWYNQSWHSLYAGASFNSSSDDGLFCVGSDEVSYTDGLIGCRLQKLP